MKAAREVGHAVGNRRDVAARGPSAGSGGGAEAQASIRRRRAHSHQPGLCSDKWGASCPDVWSRGPRASPRQRGSCLGRRRSYGGPGLTKPVQPLSPPQRGASSRTCHRPQQPRNPPLQGRRASDPAGLAAPAGLVPRPPSERCRSWSYEAGPAAVTASAWSVLPYMPPPAATPQPYPTAVAPATPQPPTVPAKAGNPPGGAGCTCRPPAPTPRPSPHMAVAPATRRSQGQHQRPQVRTLLAPLQRRQNCLVPATRRSRPTSPHSVVSSAAPSAWPPGRCTRPCWRSCSVPPPGATPSSPICGRHPLGQPARQGTQTEVNQRRIIQQPRQGCPRRETIAVLPPGQLQKTTKNTKQSYKGRLIIRHFCSPRRPSPPMKCPATLPHKAVAPPQRGR